MSAAFDPYHRWLGISPKDQPPNHYRLLAIDRFESDAEVIRDAVERQMAHVRTYQLGEYSELTQRILNELAAAKACLLDPARKAAYDGQLRAQSGKGDNRPSADDQSRPPLRSGAWSVPAEGPFGQDAPVPYSGYVADVEPPPPPAPRRDPGAMLPPSAKQALAGSPAWTQLTRGGPIRRTLHRIDAMLLGVVGKDNVLLHRCLRILAVALPVALVLAICPVLYRCAVGDAASPRGEKVAVHKNNQARQQPLPPPPPPVPEPAGQSSPAAVQPPRASSSSSPSPPEPEPTRRKLRLLPVAPQTVTAGKTLTLQIEPEEPEQWSGKLRFSLPDAPDGATIDPLTGMLAWAVPKTRTGSLINLRVVVEAPENQRAVARFRVEVRPRVLRLRPMPRLTAVRGNTLSTTVQADDAASWAGELQFSLKDSAPVGATIDPQTGLFAWSVPQDEQPRLYNFFVAADGSAGQHAEIWLNIQVPKLPKRSDRRDEQKPGIPIPDDVRPLIGVWTVRKAQSKEWHRFVGVWTFYDDGTAVGGYGKTRGVDGEGQGRSDRVVPQVLGHVPSSDRPQGHQRRQLERRRISFNAHRTSDKPPKTRTDPRGKETAGIPKSPNPNSLSP